MTTATATDRFGNWSNWATWNVVLQIQNDACVQDILKHHDAIEERDICCYEELLELLYDCGAKETRDGVKWNDPKINRAEINGDVFDF